MLSEPADVDLDLIKTIAYEEEQITTDLSEEKLLDKVVQLYPRLRSVASMEETTTYEDLTEGFTIASYARIGSILGIISAMELQRGRPPITAVVISATDGMTSGGFFSLLEIFGLESGESPDERRDIWIGHLESVHDHWGKKGRLGN